MIPQDAMTSFDPLYTIGYQMIETFVENLGISKEESKKLAIESLDKMLINNPEEVIKKISTSIIWWYVTKMYDSHSYSYETRYNYCR
ncbi:MAG: hypothetical protein ACLTDP_06420 [Terrisporobacter sp.]